MAEHTLNMAVQLQQQWRQFGAVLGERLDNRDERGEVTATTALTLLLVLAAIAAGGVIASKVVANAENVPQP